MARTPLFILLLLTSAPALAGLRSAAFGQARHSSAEAADRPWVEARSPHFRVVSDAGAEAASSVATELEKIRAVYLSVLGPEVEPEEPVLVFASATAEGFADLVPPRWRATGGARWAGLFLEAPSGYTLLLRLDLRGDLRFRTVYHEYFHYLTRRNIGRLPPWLSEGLAGYWATVDIRDEQILVGRPDYDYLRLVKRQKLLPLETLFAAGSDSPHYRLSETMNLFYAQSWALTHFFQSDEGRRRQLATYVSLLGSGGKALEAAREAFGDLKELSGDLQKYVRSRRFHGARLATPPLPHETLRVRALSEREVEAARENALN